MSFYYSTNHTASRATLRDAVVRGLAEDRGLYMPEVIKQLPATFWQEIADLTFQEVACRVADAPATCAARGMARIIEDPKPWTDMMQGRQTRSVWR